MQSSCQRVALGNNQPRSNLLIQAHCFALEYNPQPEAARIAPYKPLAPLALKADAWAITFTVSCSKPELLYLALCVTQPGLVCILIP